MFIDLMKSFVTVQWVVRNFFICLFVFVFVFVFVFTEEKLGWAWVRNKVLSLRAFRLSKNRNRKK